MKRLLLPWAMLAALLLAAFAPPILAQEEETAVEAQEARVAGGPPVPPYAVTSDGLGVVVDGDVVIACDPTPPSYAEICAMRDSLPRSTIELGGKDKAGTEKKEKELPSSGGVPLLALSAGALVVSGGLLARKILR